MEELEGAREDVVASSGESDKQLIIRGSLNGWVEVNS